MANLLVKIFVACLLFRASVSGPTTTYEADITDGSPVAIISSILNYDESIDHILDELLTENNVFNVTFINGTLNQNLYMKLVVNKEMPDEAGFSGAVTLWELRKQRQVSAEIMFLFCGILLLEITHMVFLELFVRLTRTRFQGDKRFRVYTNITMSLTFLISTINLMLILIFHRSIQLYMSV